MLATAKSANIFLRASGPALRQCSTHMLTHGASSLISVMLSHTKSSPVRSALGSVSITGPVASGTGGIGPMGVGVGSISRYIHVR